MTRCANDLRAHAVRIGNGQHAVLDAVLERGPAAGSDRVAQGMRMKVREEGGEVRDVSVCKNKHSG